VRKNITGVASVGHGYAHVYHVDDIARAQRAVMMAKNKMILLGVLFIFYDDEIISYIVHRPQLDS